MKLPIPFSRPKKNPVDAYFQHRLIHRFLHVLGVGIQKVAREHAETIAQATRDAGHEVSATLREGFEEVTENQVAIHEALIDQTDVIRVGFESVELSLDRGFEQTNKGLDEVAKRVDNIGEVIIGTGQKLFKGLAGVKASVDMGMVNIVSQFELQREEIQTGFEQLTNLLENQQKTAARERYRDGKEAYESYLRHPEEPQFLTDAKDYFVQSVDSYRGNPFCHLYLGHIYQEPAHLYALAKSLEHYKLCATYAKGMKNDALASLGYFMAAWIAYVEGDASQAIALGEESVKFDPASIPEAWYNLAKYYAAAGKAQEAIEKLNYAIQEFDPYYSVKANLDPDFDGIRDELNAFFELLRDNEVKWLEGKLREFGVDRLLGE